MSKAMGNIYLHFVFSTKYRAPMLDSNLIASLKDHIRLYLLHKFQIKTISINGFRDHLHILIIHNINYLVPEVIKTIKGESSHWLNSRHLCKDKFIWQEGYGVFSVSQSAVNRLTKYIDNQEKHHSAMSFEEETSKYFHS